MLGRVSLHSAVYLGTHHIEQASLELKEICLPLSPKTWNYRHVTPCLALVLFLFSKMLCLLLLLNNIIADKLLLLERTKISLNGGMDTENVVYIHYGILLSY